MNTLPNPIPNKWRTLFFLSFAELLGMSVWFSASAVVPALTDAWHLTDADRAWLTMSVQIGFVVGAFGSAVLNLADRIPARRLFVATSILAGVVTAMIPLTAHEIAPALLLRFLSGVFLAGVYPVGMKIMATWTKEDRGTGIGLLVGALTIGSASPHLINAFGGVQDWKPVLYLAAGSAILGGILAALFVDEGPYKSKTPSFNWKYIGQIVRDRPLVLANLGYLGHMWELYAMWSWIAIFFQSSFGGSGVTPAWASFTTFFVIGIGGVGSAVAGKLADQYGRTRVTIASMMVSGLCSLTIGFLFGANPILTVLLALVWGFAIVADSAQFSAAISELAEREYVGTALTLQTSLGFLLTLVTIRLVPPIHSLVGWRWAFAFLAIGPVVGIWAMNRLKGAEAAKKLAGGRG